MCVVVYYCSDIKICGEGGGAGGRAADQRGAGAAAAARHLGLQRADSKICSTDWNRLRVCRSALVETWPMLGLSLFRSGRTLKFYLAMNDNDNYGYGHVNIMSIKQ